MIVREAVRSAVVGEGDDARAVVIAAVTMRKARFGWWVSVRVGCVERTTWHITYDGAAARYDLGEHHTGTAARDAEAVLSASEGVLWWQAIA